MPLFGNKFSPKKPPARKNSATTNATESLENIVSNDRVVKLRLGEQEQLFQDGEWIPVECGGQSDVHKSNQKLRNKVHELQEENNLLKLKYEILLSMLTQSTAESHLQQREIEKLKKLSVKKP